MGMNDPYDWWRLANLVGGVFCFIWLMGGLKRQRHQWNPKTRDFWYSRLMWSVVSMSLSVESVYYDREITITLPLVSVAILVTFNGLRRRGSWGYIAPEDQNVHGTITHNDV